MRLGVLLQEEVAHAITGALQDPFGTHERIVSWRSSGWLLGLYLFGFLYGL